MTPTARAALLASQVKAGGGSAPCSADSLVIAGLTRLSTCDWPGRLVATVFLQGCPWRCGYCQNPELLDTRLSGKVTWPATIELLHRRRGLLDGLVFSGGEPTRQGSLVGAAWQVRELGFAVGLHTAGAYPVRLAAVLPYVDWVGLDIKALPADYEKVTRVRSSAARAFASLEVLRDSGVDHEIRITVDPTIHDEDGIRELVTRLRTDGEEMIVLQQARGADLSSPAPSCAVLEHPPQGVQVRRAD